MNTTYLLEVQFIKNSPLLNVEVVPKYFEVLRTTVLRYYGVPQNDNSQQGQQSWDNLSNDVVKRFDSNN
jgi:hypothetical protein